MTDINDPDNGENWLRDDLEDAPAQTPSSAEENPWKVLIVDDDPDIHTATRLVIQDIRYQGRGLSLLYASSAQQGFERIAEHPDTALILLDVVMETDDAGLRLVRRIREELGNRMVRIVLRTGQPGQAPVREVILNYDINDYKTKTELTEAKMFTTVVASLRAFDSLQTIEENHQGEARNLALLKESEARYRVLFENAKTPILLIDPGAGAILDGNLAAEKFYGYSRDTLRQMAVSDINQLPIQKLRESLSLAASDQQDCFQFPHRLANGEIRQVEVHSGVIEIQGCKRLYSFVYDISERKRTEKRINELLELTSKIVSESTLGIKVFHTDGSCVSSNEAAARILGEDPQAHPAENFRTLDFWEHSGLLAVANEVLQHGKTQRKEIHTCTPAGREVWLEFDLKRFTSSDEPHLLVLIHDVTEFRLTEQLLTEARRDAERANVAKSRFLATMSHEIRTPMNAILGMAQMLLVPELEDADRKDFAGTILTAGDSLLHLLNDILDLSKVEAGKFKLESYPLEPRQILHGVKTLFSEAAHHKGLSVESRWGGPPGQRYLGDPLRLRQMLSNLVSNAIKFSERGLIRIEANEVDRTEQLAILEFSVSDSGIGIPPEKQPLLFKPFSQTDSSTTRQFGGTGLGLSIVQRLANLMGGHAGVESEAGKGSRFWFRIRAARIAPAADCREIVREERGNTPAEHLKGHILVVEDNPTNRKVVNVMLSKSELHCDYVKDGQEAVEAITHGMAPDLVLMDCQMPVMDGFEATQRIRRWERLNGRPRLTIVALTAGAYEEDRRHCIEAGMDDFLVKPINIEELMATLGRWLQADKCPSTATLPTEETAPQEETLAEFDEATLLARLGGDRELARTIISSALGDMPAYFDELHMEVEAGNWAKVERKAHTLKSLSAQIGGMKLFQRLKALDDHLKAGGQTDTETVAQLRQDFVQLASILQTWA